MLRLKTQPPDFSGFLTLYLNLNLSLNLFLLWYNTCKFLSLKTEYCEVEKNEDYKK